MRQILLVLIIITCHQLDILAQAGSGTVPPTIQSSAQSINKASGKELSSITREKAFFYYMKVYNHYPKEALYCQSIPPSNFLDFYCQVFDASNYAKNKNNEFFVNSYLSNKEQLMNTEIEKVNFNTKYSIVVQSSLGKYSFDDKSFPIDYSYWGQSFFKELHQMSTRSGGELEIKIGVVDNGKSFSPTLSVDPKVAESFIKRRSASNGNVDRTVFVKKTFTISQKQYNFAPGMVYCQEFGNMYLVAYLYSIEVYEDASLTKKIGTILPETDANWIDGKKISNETVKTYWTRLAEWMREDHTSQGDMVNEPSQAKYYQVVNYENGNIKNPVNYYYMSGKLCLSFPCYSVNPLSFASGQYVKYYENGNKAVEGNMVNGLFSGTYTTWHEDGNKAEQAEFVNGKKQGCYCNWDKSGSLAKYATNYYDGGRQTGKSGCYEYCATKFSKLNSNLEVNTSSDGDKNLVSKSSESELRSGINIVPNEINNGNDEIIFVNSPTNNRLLVDLNLSNTFSNDPILKKLFLEKLRSAFQKNIKVLDALPQDYTNVVGDTLHYSVDFYSPTITYKQTGTYFSQFQSKTFIMEICTATFLVSIRDTEGKIIDKRSFDLISSQPYGNRKESLENALKDKYITEIPKFVNQYLK